MIHAGLEWEEIILLLNQNYGYQVYVIDDVGHIFEWHPFAECYWSMSYWTIPSDNPYYRKENDKQHFIDNFVTNMIGAKMSNNFTVRLQDDTCGLYKAVRAPEIGSFIEISLIGQDGKPTWVQGIVEEILSERIYHD